MDEKYKTSDLYLAAYLKLIEYKFSYEKENNKIKFIFELKENLQQDIQNYYINSSKVDALQFVNSIKNLKGLIAS